MKPLQSTAVAHYVPFDRSAGTPFYQQIYRGIRAAILDGRLNQGQRLPSTRMLANELGVSRLPVLTAYEQLLHEGYLLGRVGAGTYVARSITERCDHRPARSATSAVGPSASLTPTVHPDAPAKDGERERAFDFLIGEWTVRHRRRTQLLKGADRWFEFDGTCVARKIWDGQGHIDEFRGNSPTGVIEGMSLRLYDPSSDQWRDYYTNESRRVFEPPIVGAFRNGRAEFFSHDLFEGRSIYVRQLWTVESATVCHWEQAFSADGGRTWETNWMMELTRAARL